MFSWLPQLSNQYTPSWSARHPVYCCLAHTVPKSGFEQSMSLWNPTFGLILVAFSSAFSSWALHSALVVKLHVPSSCTHAPFSEDLAWLMHACSLSTEESKLICAFSCLLASSLHLASVT